MARTIKCRSFLASLADVQLLGVSEHRVGILFSAPTSGSYSIAFGEAAAIAKGITMVLGMPQLLITREMIGDIITAEVRVFGSGAVTIPFIEIIDS